MLSTIGQHRTGSLTVGQEKGVKPPSSVDSEAVGTPAYTRLNVDERRRQLLAEATALFATHGYDELSMAKLAREAGISKPLLYHYFPSKRDLFDAVPAQAAE